MTLAKKQIGSAATKLLVCASLLTASVAFAANITWSGGAGTTLLNTSGNWTGGVLPGNADVAVWDGTVSTNVPYSWNGTGLTGSGSLAPSYNIQGGYTIPITLIGSGNSANLLAISNIVIDAGAGAFTLGSNGLASGTVFRATGTNQFINNSANIATIASDVYFNSGGGVGRTVVFGGSGSWAVNSPWNLAAAGSLGIRVNGTGANTVTLTTNANAFSATDRAGDSYIVAGTLALANGDALGVGGPHNMTIDGVVGTRTLALMNNISLNAAVTNINIGGRNGTNMPGDAAIYNVGGDNSINGIVRFNATGGTNVSIYTPSGTLTLNGPLTCANVGADRYFNFLGAGTTIVSGIISNGSATANIVLQGGTLFLSNANTFTGTAIINSGVLTLANNLALQSSTAVINGGLLDVNGGNGFSPFVGGLSGSGVVDTLSGGSPTLSVGSNNITSVFSGNITNSAGSILSLQKVGTGSFTLAGASGYSGGTTVAGGTLLAGNTIGSATGSGNVVVNSGATLGGTGIIQGNVNWQSGSLGSFTINPTTAVSGSNSTPLTVSGSLTLNGNAVAVNVAGGTPLEAGTYRLMTYNTSGSTGAFGSGTPTYTGAGAAFGTSSSISTSGGQVTLTVTLTGVAATWTNDVNGNWAVGANWSSNPNYPRLPGDSAELGVGSAYRTVTLNANVSLGALIFTNDNSFLVANAGNTMTFAGPVGATVSVQAGSSNAIGAPVTLSTNLTISTVSGTAVSLTNTISGAKTVTVTGGGTVAISGNNTYGPLAGTVGTTLGGGGVLQLGNNNALGAGDLSVASSGTVRANTALTLPNRIIAGSGVTATVDNNGNNVTLSGVVSGAGGLAKSGAGTLVLNSANTFSNGVSINAGTLKLGNIAAIPAGTNTGNISVGTNAMLDLNGLNAVLNGLNSSDASAIVDSSTGGALTLTLGENSGSPTYLGTIKNSSGSVTLVKNGTGTQTLAGTNNVTGTTTINSGTLQLGNGNTNATGTGIAVGLGSGSVANAGVLQFNLVGTNIFANQITGTGTVSLANANLALRLTGNNTFTGDINVGNLGNGAKGSLLINNVTGLGIGPKTIWCNNTASQIHLDGSAGNISVGSSIAFLLSNGGGVLFNEAGSNTISGSIGMVNGNGNALVVVNSGFLNLAGGVATVAGNNNRTLVLGGATNGLVSGNITDGGPVCSLTKQDAGTWTLTGTGNNYSGATTVSGGTLIINGDHSGNGAIAVNGGTLLVNGNNYGSGAVTVATNGTLGGKGAIYSAVTWQLGSAGTFTTSASTPTPLTVYGNVSLTNNAISIFVAGGTPLPAGTYTLLSEGNILASISGSFATTPTITGAGLAVGMKGIITTSSSAVVLSVVNSSTWISNANGNWTTGANWDTNPNFPDTAGDFATLGVGSSLITINLNASETIAGISFTNSNSFVITNAANVLTLNNAGNLATLDVTGGTSNTIATGISLADNTSVNTATGTALQISGSVSGSSSLTVLGNGVLRLSGANTHSGTTTLGGGRLALGSTTALGSGTLAISGGSLDSSVLNLVNANNNAQNWNGSFAFQGSQNLNLGAGTVTLGNNLTLTVNSNKLTVGGPISGDFTLTVVQGTNNNSTLELDAANTFTGFVGVSGTLALGSDNVFGSAAAIQLSPQLVTPAATNLTIMSKDSTTRTITNGVSVNAFDGPYIMGGTGNLIFSGPIVSGNGQKRFTINNTTTTFSGPVTDNGAPSGPVIKDGPGTLVLSGTSTSAKALSVNGGTLRVDGSIGGSVTVDSSGTLSGSGTIGGNVTTLSGSTMSPGDSIGTLSVSGNLTLGGNLAIEVNKSVSPSNDLCVVSGTLTCTGSSWLTVANLGPALSVGNKFTLFNQPLVNGGELTITPAPGTGLSWSNRLAIDGSILVITTPAASYTETLYAVAEGTPNKLLSFQNNAPGTILNEVALGVEIFGVDFVGETLYGVGSGNLYIIDRVTGATTLVGSFSPVLTGAGFGVDAEPAGVRVVSDLDQQLILSYGNGAATVGTTLIGGGATTASGMVYHPGTGMRYVIDTGSDTLGTLDPVTGLVTTIGPTANDFSKRNGFDISGKAAYGGYVVSAAGSSGPSANLYTINLANGSSQLQGLIGDGDPSYIIRGIAVGPEFSTTSAVNSTPTNITSIVVGGTNLVLAWPSSHLGWTLQKQTNSRAIGLKTNWVDVVGSDSVTATNFPILKADPTVFYRLRLSVP